MMDCVLSGSLLVVFSLFCYAMCVFFEQINSLSLSLSLSLRLLTACRRFELCAELSAVAVRTDTPRAVVGVLIAAVLTLAGRSRLTQACARTHRRTRHEHNASSGPQTGRQKVAVVCCIVSRHRT